MTSHIVAQHPCSHCTTLTQEVARLTAELDNADRDPVWGVLTRVGLERRIPKLGEGHAAIVVDIDHLHDANDRLGHAEVDQRMTIALRVADELVVGRWQHGDEVVIFAPMCDALGLALRLQQELARLGLSATCAIVPGNGYAAVARGQRRIEEAKRADERGKVFLVSR